jgi:hypothetical protein
VDFTGMQGVIYQKTELVIKELSENGWISSIIRFPDSPCIPRKWDSVFGIATGYGLDDRGVEVRVPVR